MKDFENFVHNRFNVSLSDFFRILKSNNSADGYILGAIGEDTFRKYAESLGYEVIRIKEKPSGGNKGKADSARGDFYIRKKGNPKDEWLVVECKSVKSNAEDRFLVGKEVTDVAERKKKVVKYLENLSVKRQNKIDSVYKTGKKTHDKTQKEWQNKHPEGRYPAFAWPKDNPGAGFPDLSSLWKTKKEIEAWVNSRPDDRYTPEAFYNLKAPLRLLYTHMPSQRVDLELDKKSTGPLVSEFNILCLDLFLRTGEHILIFANPKTLNPQATAPNHLQQNYNVGVFVEEVEKERRGERERERRGEREREMEEELVVDGFKLFPAKGWYTDLEKCIADTKPTPRKIDWTQVDNR